MANTSTNIAGIVSSYAAEKLDKELCRYSPDGAYLAGRDDYALIDAGTGIVSSANKTDIENNMFNPNGVGIPVILKSGLTISESCQSTCEGNANGRDTALVDVQSECLSFDIKVFKDEFNYNVVSNEDIILRQMKEAAVASRSLFSQKYIAALEAGKNQQQDDTTINMSGYFGDSGANAWTVDEALKDDMYNQIAGQFFQMNFYNQKRVIGNPQHMASVRQMYAQGGANAENLQFQFRNPVLPGVEAFEQYNSDFLFYGDNNIVSTAPVKETAFVTPYGSTAIFHSYDKEKYGNGSAVIKYGGNTEFGTITLPGIPDVVWGYKKTYGCENGADYESWQFETKYAILTPYVEDITTDITGINKYEVTSA